MRKVIIEVTQEDIEAGIQGDVEKCPVALAGQRAFSAHFISSCGYGVVNPNTPSSVSVDYPTEVFNRIIAFDRPDGEMEPFSFEIEVPE